MQKVDQFNTLVKAFINAQTTGEKESITNQYLQLQLEGMKNVICSANPELTQSPERVKEFTQVLDTKFYERLRMGLNKIEVKMFVLARNLLSSLLDKPFIKEELFYTDPKNIIFDRPVGIVFPLEIEEIDKKELEEMKALTMFRLTQSRIYGNEYIIYPTLQAAFVAGQMGKVCGAILLSEEHDDAFYQKAYQTLYIKYKEDIPVPLFTLQTFDERKIEDISRALFRGSTNITSENEEAILHELYKFAHTMGNKTSSSQKKTVVSFPRDLSLLKTRILFPPKSISIATIDLEKELEDVVGLYKFQRSAHETDADFTLVRQTDALALYKKGAKNPEPEFIEIKDRNDLNSYLNLIGHLNKAINELSPSIPHITHRGTVMEIISECFRFTEELDKKEPAASSGSSSKKETPEKTAQSSINIEKESPAPPKKEPAPEKKTADNEKIYENIKILSLKNIQEVEVVLSHDTISRVLLNEECEVRVSGNTLDIFAKNTSGNNGNTFNFNNSNVQGVVIGNNIHVSGNILTMNGKQIVIQSTTVPNSKIKVAIPKDTSIKVTSNRGNAVIGNIGGNLNLELSGNSMVEAASVKNFNAELTGSSRVTIASAQGHIEVDQSGASVLSVEEGNIEKVEADISGSAQLTVHALIRKANIDASGASKVHLHKMQQDPIVDKSGVAKVSFQKVRL